MLSLWVFEVTLYIFHGQMMNNKPRLFVYNVHVHVCHINQVCK